MSTNTKAKAQRPSVALNPAIPVETAREIRKVANFAFDAQDKAASALDSLDNKVGKNVKDLLDVSQFVSKQVQAGGAYPISLTALTGNPASPLGNQGPGAGTYTVGAKLTVTGQNGQITIDASGRITGIQQAT